MLNILILNIKILILFLKIKTHSVLTSHLTFLSMCVRIWYRDVVYENQIISIFLKPDLTVGSLNDMQNSHYNRFCQQSFLFQKCYTNTQDASPHVSPAGTDVPPHTHLDRQLHLFRRHRLIFESSLSWR